MTDLLLLLCLAWQAPRPRRRPTDDRGQTTAEYALVLLGAASVALVLIAWAAKTGKVAELLDAVIDGVIARL